MNGATGTVSERRGILQQLEDLIKAVEALKDLGKAVDRLTDKLTDLTTQLKEGSEGVLQIVQGEIDKLIKGVEEAQKGVQDSLEAASKRVAEEERQTRRVIRFYFEKRLREEIPED